MRGDGQERAGSVEETGGEVSSQIPRAFLTVPFRTAGFHPMVPIVPYRLVFKIQGRRIPMQTDRMVDVLWISRYDYNPSWKLVEHKHDYYQIIYFMEGGGRFTIAGDQQPIRKNVMMMIRPGEQHGLVASDGEAVRTLDLKFTILDPDIEKDLCGLPDVFTFTDTDVEELLLKIKNEGLNKPYLYKTVSGLYLLQLLMLLIRTSTHCERVKRDDINLCVLDTDTDALIQKAMEYIRTFYSENLSLDKLCMGIGYNKSYVCQKFRRVLDCTPMSFIYKYRINKSKELITYSDYCLKDIATKTGFESIHHFTRVFHKVEGITPGEFRKSERSQIRKNINIDDKFVNVDLTYRTC